MTCVPLQWNQVTWLQLVFDPRTKWKTIDKAVWCCRCRIFSFSFFFTLSQPWPLCCRRYSRCQKLDVLLATSIVTQVSDLELRPSGWNFSASAPERDLRAFTGRPAELCWGERTSCGLNSNEAASVGYLTCNSIPAVEYSDVLVAAVSRQKYWEFPRPPRGSFPQSPKTESLVWGDMQWCCGNDLLSFRKSYVTDDWLVG